MIKTSSFSNEKTSSMMTTSIMKTLDNIQNSRLEKMIIKLSSWKIFIQCIFMIPSFIVPFYFGVKYFGQCPIQPLINIYMIIHACFNLGNILFLFMSFITAKYIRRSQHCSTCARYLFIVSLIGQFLIFLVSFAWLIPGQIWIFGSQSNGFQSKDPIQIVTYCNGTLFWNAFASVIVTYTIWLILILVIVGRLIIKRYKSKENIVLKYNQY